MTEAKQKSTIAQGTYHLFLGNLISTLVLAITAVIIGRLLGPDNYGEYTIILIAPTYVYLILRLGLSSTITRFVAKYSAEGKRNEAISFSYAISFLNFVFGLFVILILLLFTNGISTYILQRPQLANGVIVPVALFSVVGQILFNNGSASFIGLHQFRKSASLQIINAFTKCVVSILLVLAGLSIFGAIAGYTLGFLSAGILSLVYVALMNKSLVPRNIIGSIRTSISYAPPIFLSDLVSTIITPLQITILAYWVSDSQIGWYSAATNIATLVTLFTYPISTALLPLFSRTAVNELPNVYNQSVKYVALFVTPITVLVMTLSTQLAIAIYGSVFGPSGDYLLILAIVYLLAGFGHIWNPFLYGVGATRQAFIATGIGSAISVIASVALANYLGVYGVIVATILGNVVSLYVGSLFVSRILRTRLSNWSTWRIYFASGLSAIAVYPLTLLPLNAFVDIFVGTTVFVLILVPIMAWTKALTRSDVAALLQQFTDVKSMKFLLRLLNKYHALVSFGGC